MLGVTTSKGGCVFFFSSLVLALPIGLCTSLHFLQRLLSLNTKKSIIETAIKQEVVKIRSIRTRASLIMLTMAVSGLKT
jgi:hypothetical protein